MCTKKIICICLAVALAFALCACSSGGGLNKFSIEGKWKNVGEDTFGQVQQGSIVVFDGENCNVYSPQDTYAFYKEGSDYTLDCTSMLFSDTVTFTVKVIDNDNIEMTGYGGVLKLTRVQ